MKKKNLIIIGLILIAFVGGWGWRTYQNWPIHEGWQTLKDEEVGFSMQYPPEMQARNNSNKSATFYYLGATQSTGTELYDGINVTIIQDDLGDGGMSKYIERSIEQTKSIGSVSKPLAPTSINGISGFSYTAHTLGEYEIFFMPKGKDKVMVITYIAPDPKNNGYQKTVEDMFSTLKILR
ncbi:MAG: hypothetical protein AAB638_03435 [Patescibacteria group bacterium]